MTKWIFLGDDSRWQFVCWILKTTVQELPYKGHKTILIKHSSVKYQLMDDENLLTIVTYNLPPSIELFVPTYTDDLSFNLEEFDRCAVFETHPLGRESTEDLAVLLESSKKSDPILLFVIMDLLDEIDYEPIVDAKNRKYNLLNKNRDVIIARSDIDVLDVLHWHRPLVTDLRRRIQHELADIRSRVDDFEDYYNGCIERWKVNGCLNPAIKEKITAFVNVKGRPHIWKSYIEAAQRTLFPPPTLSNNKPTVGNIYEAIEIYKKILYNPTYQGKNLATFIWDVKSDVRQLTDKLSANFAQAMTSPKKFHGFLNNDEFNSEHIYLSLVNRPGGRFYGIKEEFFRRYEKFVTEDTFKIINNELENHTKQLKDMIDN